MDVETLAHIAITLAAILLILVILVRLPRSGYFEEERKSMVIELKNQQISSQLTILTRYVRRLMASWEYLLLIITLMTMALVLAHPIESRENLSETLAPASIDLPQGVYILYSPSGLNFSEDLKGSVVASIYLKALGEPAIIETQQKIFRAFGVLIIDCSLKTGIEDVTRVVGETVASSCRLDEVSNVYLVTGRSGGSESSTSYGKATLYYREKELEVQLRPYNETVLKPLKNLPCVDRYILSFVRSMEYSGGLVASRNFLEIFEAGDPNIAIIANRSFTRGAEFLRSTGAEIICTGSQEPGKVTMYTAPHRSLTRQLLDIAMAGLAGGVILIIFNRSVIPRIMPGSNAIIISGGTYWISRLLPLVSIAIAELLSAIVMILSYASYTSFRAYDESFISAPGVLLVSLISLAISFAHIVLERTSHYPISMVYVEKTIPARGYSYVVEDLSHRDVTRLIADSLENSEFFSVLEKEVMEGEDMVNMRLRLLYRYSIGVGADVNIYASKHNEGTFIDLDIEPWSVDDTKGGILDSVARMILSRISGAIVVGRISRGLDKD